MSNVNGLVCNKTEDFFNDYGFQMIHKSTPKIKKRTVMNFFNINSSMHFFLIKVIKLLIGFQNIFDKCFFQW